MDVIKNIELFQELVRCGNDIYTWCYDADGQLLRSNCPDEALLGSAFSFLGCRDRALQLAKEVDFPVYLGTAFGLIWGAAFEKENGELRHMYVVGPAYFSNVSQADIEGGFKNYSHLEISLAWKHQLMERFSRIPVAQNIVFARYLLMLHYCLTGERLDASDINFQASDYKLVTANDRRDRHKVWMAEQAMLQMVRNGDLNYKSALSKSMMISSGVPVSGKDPLRQAKTSTVVFTTMVCRAAIDGGLSPEEAYSLGDSYIQAAENAITYDEVSAIPLLMYDDFVRRVHRCRTNPNLSAPIQTCCDYIEMHTNQKIRAKDLAVLVGYTEYYLTHKFKEETGFCINDYVKNVKIERAKVLLKSTQLSVQEVSEELAFGTRNYFTRIFTEIVGYTPIQFREKN